MNLLTHVKALFAPVLNQLAPDPAKVPDYLAMIKPAANADHGDYQANFAMALGKLLDRKPQELAADVVAKLPMGGLIESATVAGPGFINVRLSAEFIAEQVQKLATDERLGVAPSPSPQTYVIDYSGPNVAKPLHVGHLRSTIIGEALHRLLEFAGHTVVGDNHLGDWGTQCGILIYGYKHHLDASAYAQDPVRELARLYVHVRNLAKVTDDNEEVAGGEIMTACRQETAKLHAGDPENVGLWQQFMPACLAMLEPIYQRLDVKIDHALGESFYNPMLADVVADLLAKGIAKESNGAVVVPNAKGDIPQTDEELKKNDPPALIRKRDGAFTYTTTDLATIKYRLETWKPDVMLYVVDARQALHFRTLFANAQRWIGGGCDLVHVSFGSILGTDRKPLRTRDGGVPELSDLLDEAAARGLQQYEASYTQRKESGHDVPELTDAIKQDIAEAVGVGAVKYADLSQNRTSDYVFDYKKMLATDGNTATYMQYAYARCRGIFRKGDIDDARFRSNPPVLVLGTPEERALAVQLLRLPEVIDTATTEFLPHHLTAYLWDVAKAFSVFFEGCPVLKAEDPAVRESRLLLVDLVGRTVRLVLNLLGIRTLERM